MTQARSLRCLVATLLCACATPAPAGPPCDPAGNCPGGLVCAHSSCVQPANGSSGGSTSGGSTGLGWSGGSGSGSASSTGTSGPAPLALSRLSIVAGEAGGAGAADGTGAGARFDEPIGLVGDGAGTLYVAANASIRSITASTAVVSTLAGSPWIPALAGSDGIGSAARFLVPSDLALDGAGDLFIPDSDDQTVRQLDLASGAVTTLAGSHAMQGSADGTGTNALFSYPVAVAYDGAGALYVSDSLNDTIRKLVLADGAVTTFAGSPGATGAADGLGTSARFLAPLGLAADGAGHLYVADLGNGIREIALGSSAVTTVETTGLLGATNLLLSNAGDLFVGSFNNQLSERPLASGEVTVLAGNTSLAGNTDGVGTAALFHGLSEMAFDGDGGLLVVDRYNYVIRRVDLSNDAVTTFAGAAWHAGAADGTGASAQFSAPDGLAADGLGALYVADSSNQIIREVSVASGAVRTLAGTVGVVGSAEGGLGTAEFFEPVGLELDGNGLLYVADSGNHTLRAVYLPGGNVTTVAGSAGQLGTADGVGPAALFAQPEGLAFDSSGHLYVTDHGSNTVRVYNPANGRVETLAGTPGPAGSVDGTGPAARFAAPCGVAGDGEGHLYVADENNNTLRRIDLGSLEVTTLAGTAGDTPASLDGVGVEARFDDPRGLAYDGAGSLYVADHGSGTVRRVVLSDAAVTTVIGTSGQTGVSAGPLPANLNGPSGLAVVPGQALFITDLNENVVLEAK